MHSDFSQSHRLTFSLHIDKRAYTYIYNLPFTVSHKSEYTPHMSANILVYLLKGQYYKNETWIYFRVVNVLLV